MSQQTADQKASFELDVKDFKATLSPEEREACEITTLRDVQTTVLRIQTKQASRSFCRSENLGSEYDLRGATKLSDIRRMKSSNVLISAMH